MNSKHFKVRLDPKTCELWLTFEKPGHPIRRIKNINNDVMLSFCAEAERHGGSGGLEKDVIFSDGSVLRITIQPVLDEVLPLALVS